MTARASTMRWLISDSLVLAQRNLAHVRQLPEKLFDVTLQPIMFVLLFGFVFGGVIAIPDGNYREYMLGGVLVQSLAFGLIGPATGLATDLNEGVVDRLRTLPMSRAAYLCGHVLAELLAICLAITVLSLSGLVIGWGIYTDLPHAAAGYGLLVLFAFTMVWLGTWLGLIVRTPDAAQGVVFTVVFPLTFLASTFVPIGGLSPILQIFASWNPVSALAAAVRTLFGNPTGTPPDAAWPLAHPVAAAVLWCLAILAFAMPMAIRRFRIRTTG